MREGCRSACCGQQHVPPPGECVRYYKWLLCSPPGAPRCACESPAVTWSCVRVVDGIEDPPPPVGQVATAAFRGTPYCPFFNGLTAFSACYRYSGDPPVVNPPRDPLGTDQTPFYLIGPEIVPGCDDPRCAQTACHYFIELFPCGGGPSPCGRVFGRVGLVVPVGATVGSVKIICGSGPVCFCLANQGPPTLEQDIPAGAFVVDDPALVVGAFNGCCDCGQSLGQCVNTGQLQQWIGQDASGNDIFRTVTCCCGGAVTGVTARGSYIVTQVPLVEGFTGFTSTVLIVDDAEYPLGSGNWYVIGDEVTVFDDGTTSTQTFGPPNGQYDFSYQIAVGCGDYLRQSQRDIRFPVLLSRNDDLFDPASIGISDGCNGRSEFATGNNAGSGSVFLVTVTLSFSIVVHRDGACGDDCTSFPAPSPIMDLRSLLP